MKVWHCIPTIDGPDIHDLSADCVCEPELQSPSSYEHLEWADESDLMYAHNQFSPLEAETMVPKEADYYKFMAYLEPGTA